jgi:hypothetical protein
MPRVIAPALTVGPSPDCIPPMRTENQELFLHPGRAGVPGPIPHILRPTETDHHWGPGTQTSLPSTAKRPRWPCGPLVLHVVKSSCPSVSPDSSWFGSAWVKLHFLAQPNRPDHFAHGCSSAEQKAKRPQRIEFSFPATAFSSKATTSGGMAPTGTIADLQTPLPNPVPRIPTAKNPLPRHPLAH